MTRIIEETRTCAVCGHESTQHVRMSTSVFGSCDLDFRPPPLARSTMWSLYEKCPECGYVASTIEAELDDPAFLESDTYKKLASSPLRPLSTEMTRDFYRKHLIEKHNGEMEKAFVSLLAAAWCCDDARDKKTARALRKMCLEILVDLERNAESTEPSHAVLMADLMRRSHMFDDVVEMFDGMDLGDEMLTNLLAFEVDLSRTRNDKCHTVADAEDWKPSQKDAGVDRFQFAEEWNTLAQGASPLATLRCCARILVPMVKERAGDFVDDHFKKHS